MLHATWKAGDMGHTAEHNLLAARLFNVNDYASPQAAIDALPAAGGVVVFPAGVYSLASLLITKSNTTLISQGATIKANASRAALVSVSGAENVRIVGFNLNGNAQSGIGVAVELGSCVVENCQISGVPIGIRFGNDTDGCAAVGNHITLAVDSPYGTVASAIGIQAWSLCVDGYSGGRNDTLSFQEPTHLSKNHRIEGNVILNGTHGISLYGASHCRVANNRTVGQTHRGIILSPRANYNLVEGNDCEDFGSTGIHLAYGCNYNTVAGNQARTTLSDIEGNGIKAYFNCNHNLFANNSVSGTKYAGLRLSVGCQNNVVQGNKADACGTGIEIESYIDATSDFWSADAFQPANPPANLNNVAVSNVISNCKLGLRIAARSKFAITNPTYQPNVYNDCLATVEQV